MKRQSWIVVIVCAVMILGLVGAYIISQSGSPQFSQQDAIDMTQKMNAAFRNKNVSGILAYIAPTPDVKVAGISQDQLRVLLSRYFRNSDRVSADLKNYVFASGDGEATLQFDLAVHNDGADSRKVDYGGHITLHIRRVEVPQMLGLYGTKEWRISSVESTGPDLSSFGD